MKGFTLVELLIALLILALVTTAGISSLNFSTKNSIELQSDFYLRTVAENTFNLIERVKFINSYSFIFSPRPGTVAENLLLKSYLDQSFLTNNQTSGEVNMMGKRIIWKRAISLNKNLNSLNINLTAENPATKKIVSLEIYKAVK